MQFTDARVRALRPKGKRYEVWDDEGRGLGLRVAPTGRRTWIYVYKFHGRARRLTIGIFPEVLVEEARVKHSQARVQLSKGVDPGQVLIDARRGYQGELTVGQLADEYLERYAKLHKRSWEEDERILEKDVLPLWRHRLASGITRRDVIKVVDSIVDRGAAFTAGRTLGLIRGLFRVGVARGVLESNPCVGVRAPEKPNHRDRVLTDSEIRRMWDCLDFTEARSPTKAAFRMVLITAQRPGEVTGMGWEEVDLEKREWVIQAQRTKSQRTHVVPLSTMAWQVLEERLRVGDSDQWVFASPSREGHIGTASLQKIAVRLVGKLRTPRFTPHDLRRTAATYMGSLGTEEGILGRILAHKPLSVTAKTYNHYDYLPERRVALEEWSGVLQRIIDGESVALPRC